jgi:hypothetical protein
MSGCSSPADASGFDPHRASISGRFGQVLDTVSMTDPQRFGNVLSSDGTHTWGYVDVQKASQLLAALHPACSAASPYEP